MMLTATIVSIFCLGTLCVRNGNALPPTDSNFDEYWSKADFDAAKKNRQQMEPIADISLSRAESSTDGFEDEPIFPRIVIKTKYMDEKSRTLKSQHLSVSELSSKEKETIALNFFSKYEYYNGFELVEKQELIKRMQRNHGLTPSGELDDETVTMMTSPRCGNSDSPQTFSTYPNKPKWNKRVVTYKITSYSPEISPCFTRNIIRRAFRYWARVVELGFKRKDASEEADIVIHFGNKEHGDPFPFDHEGGTLAHAFPPGSAALSGDVHFDEDEFWTMGYGPVKTTYYGNSDGAKCVFPFTFNGELYHTCTIDGKDREWCSTTSNYDVDQKFGYCPGPTLFTYGGNSKGDPCQFPFIYEGNMYSSCTSEGRSDGYKWCATTSDFENDQRWGLCPSEIDPSKGFGKSLLIVAIHEIGHAIGLDHSSNQKAIMYPTYKLMEHVRLAYDDIKGVKSLYPRRKTKQQRLKIEKCGYDKFL